MYVELEKDDSTFFFDHKNKKAGPLVCIQRPTAFEFNGDLLIKKEVMKYEVNKNLLESAG